jgi:hypothetical protein
VAAWHLAGGPHGGGVPKRDELKYRMAEHAASPKSLAQDHERPRMRADEFGHSGFLP